MLVPVHCTSQLHYTSNIIPLYVIHYTSNSPKILIHFPLILFLHLYQCSVIFNWKLYLYRWFCRQSVHVFLGFLLRFLPSGSPFYHRVENSTFFHSYDLIVSHQYFCAMTSITVFSTSDCIMLDPFHPGAPCRSSPIVQLG